MFHNYPLLELTRTNALTESFRPISASAKRAIRIQMEILRLFFECMFLMQQSGRLEANKTQK
jgi:hypothetical protein